jgi:hypothetical protein
LSVEALALRSSAGHGLRRLGISTNVAALPGEARIVVACRESQPSLPNSWTQTWFRTHGGAPRLPVASTPQSGAPFFAIAGMSNHLIRNKNSLASAGPANAFETAWCGAHK